MLLNEKNISGVSVFCRCFVLGCLSEFYRMTICESNRSQTFIKWLPASPEGAAAAAGVRVRSCLGGVSPACPALSLTGCVTTCSDSFGKNCVPCKAEVKGFRSCSLMDKWLWALHMGSPVLTEISTGLNYHNWNVAGRPNQWLAGRGLLSAAACGPLRWWARENVLHIVGFKKKKSFCFLRQFLFFICITKHIILTVSGMHLGELWASLKRKSVLFMVMLIQRNRSPPLSLSLNEEAEPSVWTALKMTGTLKFGGVRAPLSETTDGFPLPPLHLAMDKANLINRHFNCLC